MAEEGTDGVEAPECRLVMTPPIVVAALRYTGPAREVGKAFDDLIAWGQVYNVERWGPLVGVYPDQAPGSLESFVAEAWYPIPPDLKDSDPGAGDVQIRMVEQMEVASCVHVGFPDELGQTMTVLLQWIDGRGLLRASADHRQVYHEAPPGHPDRWSVEIQVPVRRS
jgi:DNA gyrase inhibitor GyrI